MAGALTGRAEGLYQAFSADERLAVRRLFSRLVTLGEGTDDTRRRAHRRELVGGSSAEGVIERFGQARLLSFDTDRATSEPTVEVTHEALIREWPRLLAWLDEDRDGLRTLHHLTIASEQWAVSSEDDGELYRGGRLETAERWAAQNRELLTEGEARFLDASVDRRDREMSTERRRVRRLQALLAALAVIAAFALVAGAVAFQQRGRAGRGPGGRRGGSASRRGKRRHGVGSQRGGDETRRLGPRPGRRTRRAPPDRRIGQPVGHRPASRTPPGRRGLRGRPERRIARRHPAGPGPLADQLAGDDRQPATYNGVAFVLRREVGRGRTRRGRPDRPRDPVGRVVDLLRAGAVGYPTDPGRWCAGRQFSRWHDPGRHHADRRVAR